MDRIVGLFTNYDWLLGRPDRGTIKNFREKKRAGKWEEEEEGSLAFVPASCRAFCVFVFYDRQLSNLVDTAEKWFIASASCTKSPMFGCAGLAVRRNTQPVCWFQPSDVVCGTLFLFIYYILFFWFYFFKTCVLTHINTRRAAFWCC